MEAEVHVLSESRTGGPGSYLRRAEALMAARSDLFSPAGRSPKLAGPGGPDPARVPRRRAGASRQLSLPLPREPGRRRSRMLR